MSTARRLERGGLIDRSRRIHFKFNGRDYSGHPGDTLASALLAQGVRLFGRSFKYHRPRGVVGAGAEEPNALVQVGEGAYRTPNLRATQVELYEGLTARTVNGWPNLAFDIGAINNRLSRLLPARFLLQDIHVATLCVAALRASYPPRRRSGPCAVAA